ncbi:MAG: right-handed parallel beta-helix repeat-containing protein, partial [Deltaproteobacteria bacterium]|nr:right-handed parallel beta-helix repeat-containing protein [Deltaproteobacteria bacterium]
MKQVFSRLTAMGVVAAMALACGGPQEKKDVVPGDATVEVDAGEVVECPAGLVPWPGGGCAPRVDECANPWELPLIGGGCVAIGPRACPKLWDPEADVDCEPGKLMEYDGNACPEGFVLTEDEVACVPKFDEDCGENQIPLLGGGCRDVGPAVEPPEPPVFDHCASGELALFGGGCVQVGPRACPKLWDPEADMDCEVGDVLPCPDGCIESEDGTYCEPVRDDCGEGERPLLGGGCKRVIPLAADCPAGPFPEAPAGATGTVYVSAGSACTEGCGSAGAPYSSLQAAVEAVPTGGAVLVGPGAYGEGVVVAKSLAIVGLCAAKVELASVVEGQPGAWGAVQGPFEVKLSGVRLAGPGFGLFAAKGSILELDQVEVMQAQGAAVYVGDATVKGSGLWLHDLLPHAVSGLQGHGVVASDGASVVLEESIIDNARAAGVAASGSKTQVELTEVLIRDTQLDDEGKQGHGVLADGGAEVTLDRVVADANRHTQVLCTGADTKLEVKESLIRNGQPDGEGAGGRGISAWDGCEAQVQSSVLRENRKSGVLASGKGAVLTVEGTAVWGTMPPPQGTPAFSASAWDSARLTVYGCLLAESAGDGALSVDPGTELELSGSLVKAIQPLPEGDWGSGVELQLGARLSMER